jgi:hypothetical protein
MQTRSMKRGEPIIMAGLMPLTESDAGESCA